MNNYRDTGATRAPRHDDVLDLTMVDGPDDCALCGRDLLLDRLASGKPLFHG